jgi:hypothetical protein
MIVKADVSKKETINQQALSILMKLIAGKI